MSLHEVLDGLLFFEAKAPEGGEPEAKCTTHRAFSQAGGGLEEQAGQGAGQDGLGLVILFPR